MLTAGPVGSGVDGGGAMVVVGETVVAVATVVVGARVGVATVVVVTTVVVGASVVVGGGPVVVDGTLLAAAVTDGVRLVLVDSAGADTCDSVVEGAKDRAARSSTIEGDGVGGMTNGSDVGVVLVAGAGLAAGRGATSTGTNSWPRHTTVKPTAIAPITSSQNEVGSLGSDHRDRSEAEAGRALPAAGDGVVAGPAAVPATGSPDGCGQMFGYCGPRSQTDPLSDTLANVTGALRLTPTSDAGFAPRGG